MARLPRSALPAHGVWHVTTRGVGRREVVLDREDGRDFLVQLWRAVERFELRALALCLMPNHYHLVVEGLRDALSKAMHRINGVYAATFNAKYRRSGHLWGDRFALWQVRDEEHLREACSYVLNNPVRAGLCERAADWPWSGSRYASSASSTSSGTPARAFETGQLTLATSAIRSKSA
jgi:putative transposase